MCIVTNVDSMGGTVCFKSGSQRGQFVLFIYMYLHSGFLGGSVVENLPVNAGDSGLILGWENPLEEEMATHSSILAWEIPWTEEPGGLQFIGLQRLRHN